MTGIEHSREFKLFTASIERNALYALYHPVSTSDDLSNTKEISEMTKIFVKLWLNNPRSSQSMVELQRWLCEVLVCRDVDAFQYYISQILLKVFVHYPDLLKRSDPKEEDSNKKPDNTVEIREILEAGSIEEFIRRYADKKVTTLGYKGLREIIKYMNSKLSLQFDTSTLAFYDASEFIQVRNIIVHNAGRISKLFLQQTSKRDLQEGELYPLARDGYLENGVISLKKVAKDLDYQIVTKFRLTEMVLYNQEGDTR